VVNPALLPEDEGFPATRSTVLRRAASDDWKQFLAAYLRPCWREVQLVCRRRGVPLTDADDLFQELLLRLLRPGKIKRLAAQKQDIRSHGNLPARYLLGLELGVSTARFRTYLQQTILNLVREHLRAQRRLPAAQAGQTLEELLPGVEKSISLSVDRQGMATALAHAAALLRAESRDAPTKAARRQYAVLHAAIAERQSAEEIAHRAGLGRSTVAGILSAARARFIALLRKASGIDDVEELKLALHRDTDAFVLAFQRLPP